MKRISKIVVIIFCLLFASISVIACKNNDTNNEKNAETKKEAIYSIDDIRHALEFDSTATVTFSSSFAKLTVSTSSGIIGLFDMQGNMNQVSTSAINSDEYDVIQIKDIGLWNENTRRVKITFYKYTDIILSEYEATQYLEAISYIQCDTKIVSVYAK